MSGGALRIEVAQDGTGIADGYLNVRLHLDACAVESLIALLEHAAHGLKANAFVLLDFGDDCVEHETVSLSAQPVKVAGSGVLVVREGQTLGAQLVNEKPGGLG